MENREIAAVFSQIADILELKDENPFRVRSYRRVAQALENVGFDISRTIQEEPDKIRSIAGVGEATFQKIKELVETGTCQEHRHLLNEIPPSLLTLLDLQNLGPKRIALFWKQLQITSVEELEQAAKSKKLRTLPKMGEKSESKILKAIHDYRSREGRIRLDAGLEIAQSMVDYLQQQVAVERLAAAGSLRRRKETIGDIDILVSCEKPADVIQTFVEQPTVTQTLAQGETKASVATRKGLQVDLRVLEDESFGSALQYFTGSKEHNVVLRERAKRLGYKISEYGLFESKTGKKVAGKEEGDIYQLLGLDLIPAELRENRGEIESAEKHQLPDLIRLNDLRGDLHMHTFDSDGKNSVTEMAAAARAKGYEFIAITDHSKALAMTGGLDEQRLSKQIAEIRSLRASVSGIQILSGIEVDVLGDGRLDLEDEVLKEADVVIASVHSRFNLSRREMTSRICRALENPVVNILAHPTGRLILKREPYEVDMEELIRCSVRNRVCLEINAYPERLDLNDVHCRMARDMGALLSINSDAHSISMLNYMSYGVDTARRGWLQAGDVINTYPYQRLSRVLAKEEYR
jgi:DNA polymerase (family 10)